MTSWQVLMLRVRRYGWVRLARCLGWFVPIRPGRIVLVYHSRSGSNTLALAQSVPPPFRDQVELVRLGSGEAWAARLRKLRICASAQVLVTTHRLAAESLADFGKPGQRTLELWHGFPLKGMTLMEPRLTPRQRRAVRAGWLSVDRVASYAPLYSVVMNACYGLDINRYAITGAPRNDWLFTAPGTQGLERLLGLSLDRQRVVLYMPTFRNRGLGEMDGQRQGGNFFGFPALDLTELQRFLNQERVHLVLKIHPVEEALLAGQLQSGVGGRIHLLTDAMLDREELELYQVLNGADALVTDYSGVCLDFLLLDRPMVFTPVDLEAYRGTRNLVLEPYSFWTPGPKAVTQASFQEALAQVLENPALYQAERAQVRSLVHTYPDPGGCARVWRLIGELRAGG